MIRLGNETNNAAALLLYKVPHDDVIWVFFVMRRQWGILQNDVSWVFSAMTLRIYLIWRRTAF